MRRASSSVSTKSFVSPSSCAENVAGQPARGARRMTLPPSASAATRSLRPVHAAARWMTETVSRTSWSPSTMLWDRRTVPPTRASQRSASTSAFPATSVPRKPTRSSEPSSGSRAARRSRDGAIAAPQPAARRTPRRLAVTSRGNQLLHARAIDRLLDVAVALDRCSDDEPVGDRQELRGGLGGDTAADQERDGGDRAPHAPDLRERRRLAPGPAGDDQRVGETPVHEVPRRLLDLDRGQGHGVLATDVGEDRDRDTEQPPVAERPVGVGLDDPLVGEDRARVDI